MFADKVEITIQAGRGGDGRLSFRREKYRAMGGPDGGNGGRGGSVVFQIDHNLNTLASFRRKRLIQAEAGQAGGANQKHGKAGEDLVVKVPDGTQVYDGDQLIADLTQDNPTAIITKGGRGGFGNAHFTSSVRQAPRMVEVGEPGESREVVMELKLVADVGLVGLPNVGKSTFLSVVTNAKPEIADYAFTTITPNLGVAEWRDYSFMIADIPGLIEGASAGKGLGDEFLRHIERTAVFLHLVDANSKDVAKDYQTIQEELKSYKIDLSDRPQLLVLSRTDIVGDDELTQGIAKELEQASGQKVYVISATAHKGLDKLLDEVVKQVRLSRVARAKVQAEQERIIIDEASQPGLWSVEKADDGFIIRGEKVEGFARRTNWENPPSVERLHNILKRMGIVKELKKQGIQPGNTVTIGRSQFDWVD